MQINFSGQITKQEFVKAYKIHYNQQFKKTKLLFGIFLVILACSTFSTIFLLISENATIQKPYLIPLVLIPFLILTYPWWSILIISRTYEKKENGYNGPIHGSINDQGLTIFTRLANANFYWPVFSSYKKSNNMILLYQGKNCFNIFTQSLFATQEDWQQFEEVLKQRLPVRNSGLFPRKPRE
jgi:hypothetical protein